MRSDLGWYLLGIDSPYAAATLLHTSTVQIDQVSTIGSAPGPEVSVSGSFLVDLYNVTSKAGTTPSGASQERTKLALHVSDPNANNNRYAVNLLSAEIMVMPVAINNTELTGDTDEMSLIGAYQNKTTGATSSAINNLSSAVSGVEGNLNGSIEAIQPAYQSIDALTSGHVNNYNNALVALQQEVALIRELITTLSE
jgi:hypothetical protein